MSDRIDWFSIHPEDVENAYNKGVMAAKNLNRKFIGIEMDEGYFNIAKKRINEA